MTEEETKFIDAESYQGKKEELSFRQIVLEHLQRIMRDANCEWKGGYWTERLSPNGQFSYNEYVPDSREVYYNAVECFADVLYPHFDKLMKEAEQRLDAELEVKRNKFYNVEEDKALVDNADLKLSVAKLWNRKKLFRELCSFLHRIKYLEGKTFEEET